MASPETTTRASFSRWSIVGIVVVAVCAVVGGYVYRPGSIEPVRFEPVARIAEPEAKPIMPPSAIDRQIAMPITPELKTPEPEAAEQTVVAAAAPSFDVVRVSPTGSAVIAGRAEAGSEVVVLDGTKEVARSRADSRGEFVALPSAPLEEGGRALTLASRDEGGRETKGDGAVMVVIPPHSTSAEPVQAPVAVLVPDAAPSRVLQPAAPTSRVLTLDVVDYDEAGAIRFTGRAIPTSLLRVYVDNGDVGDAHADTAGRWVLTPKDGVKPGMHQLRVDALDSVGRVFDRVELPFERSLIPVAELSSGHTVVQPGQNLWRLARSAYGTGVRYTVIYLANRDQIRDPNRIYPGQAFALPTR